MTHRYCSTERVSQSVHPLRRDRQLGEREAAVALREQRVGGGMDSDLLATFGDLPKGNSSASKEVGRVPVTFTIFLQASTNYGPGISHVM